MMPLLWVMLWSMLLRLALSSGPDPCTVHEIHGSQNVSSLLETLHCHNDYESYVLCKWREGALAHTPLQLWFQTENSREQCVPCAPVEDPDEHSTAQCRYETRSFSIGVKHTVFFLKNKARCSSVPHEPVALSQLLRVRPPVDLSTYEADDGRRWLRWSSPYPLSSSVTKNLMYQINYRTDRQNNWAIEDTTSSAVKLDKQFILPGRRYEARVRGRGSVGQWSDWSPVVTWRTEEDSEQSPSLHCVLVRETEVVCSWEVSKELDQLITYQLACHHNQTALSERCCVNQTVRSDVSGMMLRYSCSLTASGPEQVLLELLPVHNAKTFRAHKHIRPNRPQQVKVRERDKNWIVEWTKPSTASKIRLYYQVCYYSTLAEESPILLNISEASMSLAILDTSLTPSQRHQVKIRSLVVPGQGSRYEGTPSEWTEPVDWTSHEATWSLTTLIYISMSVFVATVFLTLYCTIPACQRSVIVWVESVPSPGKSKIFSEMKSATNRALMQNESTSVCKVQNFGSSSTCSSNTPLWPTMDTDKQSLEQDKGCWSCDNLLSPFEKVNGVNMFSMNFSGPYIFCQSSEPICKSVDDKCELTKKKEENPSHDSKSPSSMDFTLFGEGYVCLPSRSTSRSTQDLVCQSDANKNTTKRHDNPEQHQPCPDNALRTDKLDIQPDLGEPARSHHPPVYISPSVTPWPNLASGYCLLPTAVTGTPK